MEGNECNPLNCREGTNEIRPSTTEGNECNPLNCREGTDEIRPCTTPKSPARVVIATKFVVEGFAILMAVFEIYVI